MQRSEEIGEINIKNMMQRTAHFASALFALLSFTFIFGAYHVKGQSNTNYAIQANIIYRFTKYIDWPKDKKRGDFIIGIIGDSPLIEELQSFTLNKTAGAQKITLRKFSSSSENYDCQILFISEEESASLKKIALRTSASPVLIVTESDGLASKGSCINFIIAGDRMKIEINKNNIERRDLSIASELLQLGIVVK